MFSLRQALCAQELGAEPSQHFWALPLWQLHSAFFLGGSWTAPPPTYIGHGPGPKRVSSFLPQGEESFGFDLLPIGVNPHLGPRARGFLLPLPAAGAFCFYSSSSRSTGSLPGLEGGRLLAPLLKVLTPDREGWEEVGEVS